MEENKEKNNYLKKKEIWISSMIGLVLGLIIMYLIAFFGIPGFGHETVATFKGGKITKTQVYNEAEKYDMSSYALEAAQNKLLEKKYKLTEKQKQEIKDEVKSILDQYMANGSSEEDALELMGLNSKDQLMKYLEESYRRELCAIDYLKTTIAKEEIENYYNENDIYGEIKTKHILVRVTDDVTDEQALDTVNKILEELKSGKSFDDVEKEYDEEIIVEEVKFDSFSAYQFDAAYVEASKNLEKDTYTTEPVKTSYGYHIIYCIDKEQKPALEDVEGDIVEILAEDLDMDVEYAVYKALVNLGEEYNLKFNDKNMQEQYELYCAQIKALSE